MLAGYQKETEKNIPLIINQYFRAKYIGTQINCVPFQVIQVKHQAVGRRRENKNAVALDSEQVTNLCFNTSTAIELAVWNEIACESIRFFRLQFHQGDDRKYVCGSQARNEIADKNTIFHYFFDPAPLQDPCRMHVQKTLLTACVSLASKDHVFKSFISLLGLVASSELFTLQNL